MFRTQTELGLNIPTSLTPVPDFTEDDPSDDTQEWRERVKQTLIHARHLNSRFTNDRKNDGIGTLKATHEVLAKAKKFQEQHRNWRAELEKLEQPNSGEDAPLRINDLNKVANVNSVKRGRGSRGRLNVMEPKVKPVVTKIFLPSLETINELGTIQDLAEAQALSVRRPSLKKERIRRSPSTTSNRPTKVVHFQLDVLNKFKEAISKTDLSLKELHARIEAKLKSRGMATRSEASPYCNGCSLHGHRSMPSIPVQNLETCHRVIVNARRLSAEFADDNEQHPLRKICQRMPCVMYNKKPIGVLTETPRPPRLTKL